MLNFRNCTSNRERF